MKTRYFFKASALTCALALLVGIRPAQAQLGTAQVQGVQGNANFTVGNGPSTQLKKGAPVPAGATITTERGAAADLYLGPECGTIRLTQSTVVVLDKLDRAQTLITLNTGSFVGKGAKLPPEAEFQIKLPHGIVGVAQGRY